VAGTVPTSAATRAGHKGKERDRCHNRVVSDSHSLAVGKALAAIVVLAFAVGATTLVGEVTSSPFPTTYGGVSTSFAVLEAVVGIALLVAALLLASERSTVLLASLTVAASVAWLAPVAVGWDGGPGVVRGIAQVAAPLLPPLVLAIAICIAPAAAAVGRAAAVVAVVLVLAPATSVAVALVLVRDPIRARDCWSDCTANALLAWDDPALADQLLSLLLALGIASGALTALVALVRLARAVPVMRRTAGPALVGAGTTGLALAAYAAVLLRGPHEVPGRHLYATLFVLRALLLLALAVGLGWLALRPRLVRGLVTRLAVDLERSAAAGGLGRVLAGALGDPLLRLGYPVGTDPELLDSDGQPVVLEPGSRVTPIVGDAGVVALVGSEVTTPEALGDALGPAAHLALGNERLRAETLARLADVTESRARIVETADAARRRMERDLHDGAQQRILALSYDLRIALELAEAGGNGQVDALRKALERAVTAATELRDVAHGIFPAELTASGLASALESLADVRPLRLDVDLPNGRRYAPEIEAAAYAVVVEAIEAAQDEVGAVVYERDGMLGIRLSGVSAAGDLLVRIEDRVGASGGHVDVVNGRIDVLLPCR